MIGYWQPSILSIVAAYIDHGHGDCVEAHQCLTGPTSTNEMLIHFNDLPDYEATWKPFNVIHEQFSSFHLVDKMSSWEGSNIRSWPMQTYVRRIATRG